MTTDKRYPFSRPQIMSAGGVGLAAAASPTFAQTANPSPAPEELEDPRGKYPKPPFRKQSQPWLGLARRMDPRPDHGE